MSGAAIVYWNKEFRASAISLDLLRPGTRGDPVEEKSKCEGQFGSDGKYFPCVVVQISHDKSVAELDKLVNARGGVAKYTQLGTVYLNDWCERDTTHRSTEKRVSVSMSSVLDSVTSTLAVTAGQPVGSFVPSGSAVTPFVEPSPKFTQLQSVPYGHDSSNTGMQPSSSAYHVAPTNYQTPPMSQFYGQHPTQHQTPFLTSNYSPLARNRIAVYEDDLNERLRDQLPMFIQTHLKDYETKTTAALSQLRDDLKAATNEILTLKSTGMRVVHQPKDKILVKMLAKSKNHPTKAVREALRELLGKEGLLKFVLVAKNAVGGKELLDDATFDRLEELTRQWVEETCGKSIVTSELRATVSDFLSETKSLRKKKDKPKRNAAAGLESSSTSADVSFNHET